MCGSEILGQWCGLFKIVLDIFEHIGAYLKSICGGMVISDKHLVIFEGTRRLSDIVWGCM